MSRKHNVKEIHLQIDKVKPFVSEVYSGLTIVWSSDIGWGEYTLYTSEDKWYADSEYMDRGEDKEFISELMRLFIEQLEVE